MEGKNTGIASRGVLDISGSEPKKVGRARNNQGNYQARDWIKT